MKLRQFLQAKVLVSPRHSGPSFVFEKMGCFTCYEDDGSYLNGSDGSQDSCGGLCVWCKVTMLFQTKHNFSDVSARELDSLAPLVDSGRLHYVEENVYSNNHCGTCSSLCRVNCECRLDRLGVNQLWS